MHFLTFETIKKFIVCFNFAKLLTQHAPAIISRIQNSVCKTLFKKTNYWKIVLYAVFVNNKTTNKNGSKLGLPYFPK